MKMTEMITKRDVDMYLRDKLDNLCGCEISKDVYERCIREDNFAKLNAEIWSLLSTDPQFSQAEYYDGLAKEYEAENEQDLKSAELYNCDLLYMVAIANILGLPRPKTSCDLLFPYHIVLRIEGEEYDGRNIGITKEFVNKEEALAYAFNIAHEKCDTLSPKPLISYGVVDAECNGGFVSINRYILADEFDTTGETEVYARYYAEC